MTMSTLRVANLICGPDPTMGSISMDPVVPPEPNADAGLGPYRHGGPQKRRPKRIEAADEVLRPGVGKGGRDLPTELLFRVFHFLSADDLKNTAAAGGRMAAVAVRHLQALHTWRIEDSHGIHRDEFLKTMKAFLWSPSTKSIKSVNLYGCVRKDNAFSLLDSMTGITRLCISLRDTKYAPHSYSESDFVAEFGQKLLPQLVDLCVYPSEDVEGVVDILLKTPNLEKLLITLPLEYRPRGAQPRLGEILTQTVGKHLRELRFDMQNDDRADNYPPMSLAFSIGSLQLPDIGAKDLWPSLRLVEFGRIWARDDRDDEKSSTNTGKINFPLSVWEASKRHGGWSAKFREPLAVELTDLSVLQEKETEEARSFLRWLNEMRGDDDVIISRRTLCMVDDGMDDAARNALFQFVYRVFGQSGINVKLWGEFPPAYHPVTIRPLMSKLSGMIDRLTIDIEGFEGYDRDYGEAIVNSQTSYIVWTGFLKLFLPMCHDMETFRILSNTTGIGGDIPLGYFEEELAQLCEHHKLRHLEVDASALTQPEINAGSEIGVPSDGEEPHLGIKHLAWISQPELSPRNSLLNLRTLKLKSLFLHRQTELIWFENIPAKLKNLERLQVDGLVWHVGYDRELALAEGDEWGDAPTDLEFYRPVNMVFPRVFLREFKDSMRTRLGLTEENCLQNHEYRERIESWYTVRDQLECRQSFGCVWLRRPIPHSPSTPPLGEDDGDDSDRESTDSGFGADPRYSRAVDEELRAQRLGEWVAQLLVSTARKTGGRCRDVVITNVRVNSDGLMPWYFTDLKQIKNWIERVSDYTK